MKSIVKYAGIAAILTVMAGVIALAQTDTGTLRRIEQAPNGGIPVRQTSAVISGVEYRGYNGLGVDGRCVMVFAPGVTIFDSVFSPGNDDALAFVGDTRAALVANCIFPANTTRQNDSGKALIGYTNGVIYGAADGYAATFYRCDFQGSSIRLSGGVWRFIGCKFAISALGAIGAQDARIDLIDCDFNTIPKPANWTYWYQNGDPCGVRVCAFVDGKQAASPLLSRFFIANCRLDGKPADGSMLCRRFPTAVDQRAGRTAYGLAGSVPSTCFLKTPN